MKLLDGIKRLWHETDGYIVTTETIIHATLTVCVLIVGLTSLRIAILFVSLDAAEALASRESGFQFSPPGPFRTTRVFPDPPFVFPDVGPTIDPADRPTPTDASKED